MVLVSAAHRKALLHFLQDWKMWSTGQGAESALKARADARGLCTLTQDYDYYNKVAGIKTPEIHFVLKHYLERDYWKVMRSNLSPFNKGIDDYAFECMARKAMENPLRRAWVDKMIGELSEELPADS